jgi:putative sugar O-methyltransferase
MMDEGSRAVVCRVREAIARMRNADRHFAAQPDRMWSENLATFRYLLDSDDLSSFEALRGHTHHITGDPGRKLHWVRSERRSVVDRIVDRMIDGGNRLGVISNRRARAIHFRRWLRSANPPDLLLNAVIEPPFLGGSDIPSSVIGGRPYNFETSRFLVTLLNLWEWNAVPLNKPGLRVADIGSGWGGLAYFMRKVLPGSHITLVDLPETFIFSMPYLMLIDREKTFYVPNDSDGLGDPSAAGRFDYSFYTPGALERFPDRTFDLIINTGSMAEMSEEQVSYYLTQIKRVGKGAFYSLNEDRQGRNQELGNLTELLDRKFSIWQGRHSIDPFRAIGCTW